MVGRGHGSLGSGPSRAGAPSGVQYDRFSRRSGYEEVLTPTHSGRGRGRGTRVHFSRGRGRGSGRGNSDLRSSSNSSAVSVPNEVKSPMTPEIAYEMPGNTDEIAQDFDIICDLLHSGRVKISDYLSKKFGFDVSDPENWPGPPKGANLFHDRCFPTFPTWPKGGNPYELLPLKRAGYFPFDEYGKMVFSRTELNKWFNSTDFDEELFEIQFRELSHVLQFNGKWTVDLNISEGGSYGTCKIFSNYSAVKQSERIDLNPSLEPDSGFVTVSFDDLSDPLSLDLESLEPNDFSWEPYDGSGFVQPNEPLSEFEYSTIIRSQVPDWSVYLSDIF